MSVESDNDSVTSENWALCEDIKSEHSDDSEWSPKKERKREIDEAESTVEKKVKRFRKKGGGVEGVVWGRWWV